MNGSTVPSTSATAPIIPALRASVACTSKAVATMAKSRSIAPPIRPMPPNSDRSARPFCPPVGVPAPVGQREADDDRDGRAVDAAEGEALPKIRETRHQGADDREGSDQRIGRREMLETSCYHLDHSSDLKWGVTGAASALGLSPRLDLVHGLDHHPA